MAKRKVLANVQSVLPGYFHTYQLGKQRSQKHAVHHAATELGCGCIYLVHMQGTEIPAQAGKALYIIYGKAPFDLVAIANRDIVERQLCGGGRIHALISGRLGLAVLRICAHLRDSCLRSWLMLLFQLANFTSISCSMSSKEDILSISLTSNDTPNCCSNAVTRLMWFNESQLSVLSRVVEPSIDSGSTSKMSATSILSRSSTPSPRSKRVG